MAELDPVKKKKLEDDFLNLKRLYRDVVNAISNNDKFHSDFYSYIKNIKELWDKFLGLFGTAKNSDIINGNIEGYIRNALMGALILSQKKDEKVSSSVSAWSSGPFTAFQDKFQNLQTKYQNDPRKVQLLKDIVSLAKEFASRVYSPDGKAILEKSKFQIHRLKTEIDNTFRDDRTDVISSSADKSISIQDVYGQIREYLKNLESASVTGVFKAYNGVKFKMQYTEAPYHFAASLLYEILTTYKTVDDVTELPSYGEFISSFDQFYLETHGDEMVKGAFLLWKNIKKDKITKAFHLLFSKLKNTPSTDALRSFVTGAETEAKSLASKKISRIKSSDRTEFDNLKAVMTAFDDTNIGASYIEATKGILELLTTAVNNINFSEPSDMDELKQIKETLRSKQFISSIEMAMRQIIAGHTGVP